MHKQKECQPLTKRKVDFILLAFAGDFCDGNFKHILRQRIKPPSELASPNDWQKVPSGIPRSAFLFVRATDATECEPAREIEIVSEPRVGGSGCETL